MRDVPSDPVLAYDGFVRQAGEMGEDLIARVHRRFFLDEWNFAAGHLENHMVWGRYIQQLTGSDNHASPILFRQPLPDWYGSYLVGNYNSYIS